MAVTTVNATDVLNNEDKVTIETIALGVAYSKAIIDKLSKQKTTITPPTDADHTISADANLYGYLNLADGSWTATHNIILDNVVRSVIIDNSDGTYIATVKTAAGTGTPVGAGEIAILYNDGTNVVEDKRFYSKAQSDALLALKASLTGAIFTGQVKGITPVAAADLTRKDYVDTLLALKASLTYVNAKPTFKNLFTNGTLLSWQEGVPTGITSTNTPFADVLSTIATSGATLDISQQKTSLNSESARITASVASTDLTGGLYVSGHQCKQFELQNFAHLKDKYVTLQVKFKASETGDYAIAIRNTAFTNSYVTTFNYTTADTEQLVSFTINLDSTKLDFTVADNLGLFQLFVGADNNGTLQLADANKDSWQSGNYLTTDACVNWSSTLNAYIEIGDIQIEEGTEATAVERPDAASNLIRCQRYYWKSELRSFIDGGYASAGSQHFYVDGTWATKMRAAPTVNVYNEVLTNTTYVTTSVITSEGCYFDYTSNAAGNCFIAIAVTTDARL